MHASDKINVFESFFNDVNDPVTRDVQTDNEFQEKLTSLKEIKSDWIDNLHKYDDLKQELKAIEKKMLTKIKDIDDTKLQNQEKLFNKAVPENRAFIAGDKQVYNLADLKEYLNKVDEEEFCRYVNQNKNDFSQWINDVFEMPTLANKVRSCTTKEDMVEVLNKFK